MGWIRLAPSDRRAPQAELGCSETASQPLSQTLWPFHKRPHQRGEDHGLHCCGHDAPNQVPEHPGVHGLPTRPETVIGHRPGHRPQQPGASRQSGLASPHGASVGATPTRHRQSRPVVVAPTVRWCHGEAGCESSRSSGQLVQSCRQIVHQMEKLLEAHQLHRLRDSGVPHQQKRPFGIRALLGQLHQSAKAR